jgi:hypothetical protein
MRRKGDTQMSLDLPTPTTKMLKEVQERPAALSDATVYSFSERKTARDKGEAARHFGAILQLVSHFK